MPPPTETSSTNDNAINNFINNNPYLTKVKTALQSLQPHQKFAMSLYLLTVLISFIYSSLFTAPPNYFTNKRNFLNVFFVKLGWFWVTVVYMVYLYFVQSHRQSYERGLARYGLVSLYWYLMTQWLLGPSFIERVFVATGGSCTDLLSTQSEGINVNQYAACKRAGGTWNGGHDVSGHCVLLILSSLFLWEEAVAWAFYSIPAVQRLRANTSNRNAWYSVLTVFGLLVFWWWMLVVTSVYFHGHFELLSGCFFGVLGWAIVYIGILPRLPQVGLPPIQL